MALTIADNLVVNGTLAAGNITANGQTIGSAALVNGAGSAQGNATALTASINLLGNVVAGTGVALPVAGVGSVVTIINGNSTTVQVYGAAAAANDLINGVNGNLGVALYGGSVGVFYSAAAGNWTAAADSANEVNYVANATNANFTFSAANITGGSNMVVFQNTATTGNLVATLPTAAATVLAIQAPSNQTSYVLRFVNSSASAGNWSIANATGWSLFGNMIIPTLSWRDFQLAVTSASGNTTTLRNIGLGTFVT